MKKNSYKTVIGLALLITSCNTLEKDMQEVTIKKAMAIPKDCSMFDLNLVSDTSCGFSSYLDNIGKAHNQFMAYGIKCATRPNYKGYKVIDVFAPWLKNTLANYCLTYETIPSDTILAQTQPILTGILADCGVSENDTMLISRPYTLVMNLLNDKTVKSHLSPQESNVLEEYFTSLHNADTSKYDNAKEDVLSALSGLKNYVNNSSADTLYLAPYVLAIATSSTEYWTGVFEGGDGDIPVGGAIQPFIAPIIGMDAGGALIGGIYGWWGQGFKKES